MIPTQKEIAAGLRAAADNFPEETDTRGPVPVWSCGGLVVKCRPYRDALLQCAAKFEKRSPPAPFHPPRYRRPHRDGLAQVAAKWAAEGDTANAEALTAVAKPDQ